MSNILVVDDEPMVANVLAGMLGEFGHEVTVTSRPEEAQTIVDSRDFDLYLFDLRMPQPSGEVLTRRVKARRPEARVLIMTAYPHDPAAIEALDAGAVGLVRKPFEISKIISFLEPPAEGASA
ncbi:MAG: response regulator [Spirochaetota bacterium]